MPAYLSVIEGAIPGQLLPVGEGQRVTLGRSRRSSDYAFEDPLLSRQHCAVQAAEGKARVVDLDSKNGTFVNGRRIGASLLQTGDELQLGKVKLRVTLGAPPDPAQLPQTERALPQPLAGYVFRERLESSFTGELFLAQQDVTGRTVLIKTLARKQLADDEASQEALRRFMREVRTGGRLHHPCITEVYDVHELDDVLYLVCEHVEGWTLSDVLNERKGGLPGPRVLEVMRQVAVALAYAHEQGVVHRDVSPGNVIVRKSDGVAKLQGFRLVKDLASESVVTSKGQGLGNMLYVAPEQVQNAQNVTLRADVYGWAATLYHCIAGVPPVEAKSYADLIRRIFNEEPVPLIQREPTCPPALSDLVSRCLEREPSLRLQTMADVIAGLDPIIAATRS
ncbi:MAG: protein kinase [Planctomycetes bacterium]|nr:protein kinase [Planctomycetota bacterium]